MEGKIIAIRNTTVVVIKMGKSALELTRTHNSRAILAQLR